jgi:hypothetical protein
MSAMPQMVGVFYERGCGLYVVKTQQTPKNRTTQNQTPQSAQDFRDINESEIKPEKRPKNQRD